jgi:coniferyl-aldehyde dehydrogenase
VASSRVYVQEGIYDQVVKKLVEKAKAWVVGDPFDPQVQQGPQVDKKQYEKILSYIEHGKREGATLLTGGKPLGGKGYYIEPTIFTDFKVYIYILSTLPSSMAIVSFSLPSSMAVLDDLVRKKCL